MSFTFEQKKEYLSHHGNNCPYCGSNDIRYVGHEFDETIEIYVGCYNCLSTWTALYKLYDIQKDE